LAGGRAGAQRAIEILRLQLARTMQHLGCASMEGVGSGFLDIAASPRPVRECCSGRAR
jgi:isopentenyl diphosphate isomerase/L-lactate dehydrogenase-like FMN-dependent dehydrogenase